MSSPETASSSDRSIASPEARRRRRGLLVLAAAVSIGLLVSLLWRVEWTKLKDAVLNAKWSYLIAALGIHHGTVFLQSWRWHLLMRNHSETTPLRRVHRINFSSVFFDLFTPGKLGSDGYRFVSIGGDRHYVIGSLVAVRLQGLVVTVAMAATMTAIYVASWRIPIVLISTVAVIVVIGIGPSTGGTLAQWLRRLEGGTSPIAKGAGHVLTVASRVRTIIRGRGTLAASSLLAIAFVLAHGLTFAIVGKAFEVNVSFGRFLWISSLVLIAAGLPIVIHGRGLAEAIVVWALVGPGVHAEAALVTSLGKYAITLGHGLAAGAFLASRKLITTRHR